MSLCLSLLVMVMTGVGVYCILQPNIMRIILGILLLGNAGNLILFVAAGIDRRLAPIISGQDVSLSSQAADPVPQALILTAIVIGFGITSFFLIVCRKFYSVQKSGDLGPEIFE